MPAPVCQLLHGTTVFSKIQYCKTKHFFLIFCLFFMHYLCEKYYKPITAQYCIVSCVSWGPRLTLLDLEIHAWDGTYSYVGDLLYLLNETISLV